ncbi:hypothetical protein Poli38472_003141 [Pythium oligandrum]|uniref:Sensor domain-containing protein n=1 Tax=Pythium oligandrum TaxID=41045 RepID=A0A8K1C1X2_PYTOL|nr:hypothetical protein Poli38472_014942 [Pythium oligandrum]TMW57216.1 hypothetical protein Poli38472_003141 [Pythium oligandrum]|eukprot:TMW54922.1 hypothetical protein Poli38472_014942 [Pythium oligandrum]
MESPHVKCDYTQIEVKKVQAPAPSAPSAPEFEAFVYPTDSPRSSPEQSHNPPPPTLTPSSNSDKWVFALKVVGYQLVNAVLAFATVVIVATMLFLSIALLPVFGLGFFVYRGALPLVREVAMLDSKLANLITPDGDRVCFTSARPGAESILCVAPDLHLVSLQSTLVVAYYLTLKPLIAGASIALFALVILPFLPIMNDINGYYNSENRWVAGIEVGDFHFYADPVWYALGCVGISTLTKLLACLSRDLTRAVCCQPVRPMAVPVATL